MARPPLTHGQLEAAISEGITRFEKEYMGRGPFDARTYLVDDMVIIRLRGILTRAEQKLARTDHGNHGRTLIKQMRIELIENNRAEIEALIKGILRRKVKSLHIDLSTKTGEKIIVLSLDRPVEVARGTPAI